MTREYAPPKKPITRNAGTICLVLLLFFCLALMLRRADIATNCMRNGLILCARTIVPSLFPFMVLSEILVSSNVGEYFISPLIHPLGKRIGFSHAGCCAIVLGLICGFPIGARCAISSYEKGRMEKEECERVLACSSIPSPAFLISTVGTTLWQDTKFGIFLYISLITSALLGGILLYVLQKRGKKEAGTISTPTSVKIKFEANMFSSAIRNATLNTLFVCAYIVFFATLTGTVEIVLGRFARNEIMHTIVTAFLELSGGVSAAAQLSGKKLAAILTGATVGWSGLSVHCQMLSFTDKHDINLRPYFISKLLQMILCACMALMFQK